MAIYRTGQASMDAQGYITGYGTKWREQLTLIRPGATIFFLTNPMQAAVITEVISDTSIRAITTGGAVVAKTNYLIMLHDSITVDGLAQDVAETLRYYQGKETEFARFIEVIETFDWDKLQQIQSDVKSNADAAAASQNAAKTSENNAKTSATNAENSKKGADTAKTAAESARDAANTAKTGAESAKAGAESARDAANTAKTGAESARDQAEEYAKQAGEPYKDVLQPLPDVWIPFNDSLDMIAGFSPSYKKIIIGDDEITMPGDKIVKFKRASTATYINKSGVFTVAAIDEPRFERDGLLIEGQRTNYMLHSESPASWGRSSNMDVPETGMDNFGFTYGKFVCNDSLIGQTSAINMASIAATKSVDVSGENKYVTTSCRFKTELSVRVRIRFDKYDGSSTTFLGDVYINTQTLEIKYTGGAASRITARVTKDEATGWVFAEATIQSINGELNIGSQIQYSPQEGGATVSGDYIYLATPQVENGSCASSFIISGDTATTRSSDVVTIPSQNNLAVRPFTVLCEVNKNWSTPPNVAPRIFDVGGHQIDDNYLSLGFVSTGKLAANIGMIQPQIAVNGDKFVVGLRAKSDLSVNAIFNGNYTTNPNGKAFGITATSYRFGGQTAAGTRHLFGHIRNFRIWFKELTDHQLGEIV
nr:tail protein [Escherichia phage morffagbaw]